MAKIVLTISADNKATQSVKLLNAEVQTLSKTLSSISVKKDLTTQINALTKHYKTLADAATRVNEATAKRQLIDSKVATQEARTATEKARKLNLLKQEALLTEKANSEISRQNHVNALTEKTLYSLAQAKERDIKATQKQTVANNHNTQSIISMTVNIFKWQIAMTSVMKPLRLLQDAWASLGETLVKTEDSVIAIQRVLSENIADGEISSRLYKIAQEYGQTFENVSQIAQNFARTGMSWADTVKATEAAILALNVAELDAEEATTGLVAILSQFGLKASDLETVIDKLNKTADNFPVTTEKILAALQRTGSAADNANLSLEQTIALVTALSKATGRSGENIGTALNSLIQYSSKASALDVFAGLSDNTAKVVADYRKGAKNILEVWQAVSQEIQHLSTEQANLLDSYFATEDGAALSEALDGELEDIYTELGGVYDTANTFRKNYFIALLGNMDTVEQAMGTLQGAAGYSQEENQKYLDTYTAKLNTLKAQWEDIANSEQGLLGLKKVLVDIGSALLTASKWTGGLRTALIAAGTALGILATPSILKGLDKISNFFKNLSNPLKNFQKSTEAATKAQQAQTLATNLQTQADKAAAVANQVRNTASASGAAIESAETAAMRAQTIATQAQTRADQLAAEAAKAKGAAFSTVLGIIGIGATIISAVVGYAQERQRQREEERKQTIENYRTIEDTYKELKKLNGQYKELANNVNRSDEQEKDFNDIEDKLVEVLKDKYNVLTLLTEGTDEYTEAVKRLADQEQKEYERNLIDAQKAAEKGLANAKIGKKNGQYGELNIQSVGNNATKSIKEILQQAGVNVSDDSRYYLNLNDSVKGNNVADQLYNYAQYSKALNALQEARNEALKVGDTERAEAIANSQAWKNFKEAIDSTTTSVKDYFDTTVALKLVDYKIVFGDITTQEDYDKVLNWIQNQINADEYYNETINNVLAGLIDFSKLAPKVDAFNSNNIQDVKNKYEDLIETLKELRDLEDESVNLEEKKAEYLEAQNELIKAQQALEDARNQATVRRFNEATGQWEWQVDEKKVAQAEETVKRQEENVEKAREQLEKQAYDTIISLLDKNNPPTNDELNDLLDGLKDFLGEQFITDIKEAFIKDTQVDLDKPINQKQENADREEASAQNPSAVDYHGIQVLRNEDGTVATGKGINKDKIGDNGEVSWNGKTYKIENGGKSEDKELEDFVSQLGLPDRTIFAYKGSIYGVLDGGIVKLQARAHSYGDNSDKGYKALSDAATNQFGTYDSGGIANGLGFMAKATEKPETVNDPELTRKILTPVSNREFETYTKQLGIMFAQAHDYARMPQFERVNNTTDNRVDNSGQVNIRDVHFAAEAQNDSISHLFAQFKTIPN